MSFFLSIIRVTDVNWANIFKLWPTPSWLRRINRGINRVNQKRTIFYVKDPLIATSVPRVDILVALTTGFIGGVQANLGLGSALGEWKKAKNGVKWEKHRRAKPAEWWLRKWKGPLFPLPRLPARLASLANFFVHPMRSLVPGYVQVVLGVPPSFPNWASQLLPNSLPILFRTAATQFTQGTGLLLCDESIYRIIHLQ